MFFKGVNTWLNWILFLSFFISLLTYIEACVADFEASIADICDQYDDLGKTKVNTDLQLNQTIELHAEITKCEKYPLLTKQNFEINNLSENFLPFMTKYTIFTF